MRSASTLLTASPSPVPGIAELRTELSLENRMKSFFCSSAEFQLGCSLCC
jgi:hypothetical protein